MFERFKNDIIKEELKPYNEPEPEYPVGTVPLHQLNSGTYFYTFVIVHDKLIPSSLYRVVGKWLPSNRIAALGWATDEDDGDHLTEFDPNRKVMPVVVDDIPTRFDLHIGNLVVDEDGMEVYRVVRLLVNNKHEVLGFRLETPSCYPGSDYMFKNVLLTENFKYRKIMSFGETINRKIDGEVL